jgi:hypothetical protein
LGVGRSSVLVFENRGGPVGMKTMSNKEEQGISIPGKRAREHSESGLCILITANSYQCRQGRGSGCIPFFFDLE